MRSEPEIRKHLDDLKSASAKLAAAGPPESLPWMARELLRRLKLATWAHAWQLGEMTPEYDNWVEEVSALARGL